MYFLKDDCRKIIFGWNAKAGCSTIKRLYYYFQNDKVDNEIHLPHEYQMIDTENLEEYTIIIFIRNLYN